MNKKRFKHSTKVYIIGILILIAMLAGGIYWIDMFSEESRVENIAKRIEHFKNQHGRLPNVEDKEEMLSLGFELRVGWHPDFIPLNDIDYELRLHSGFDEPDMVYNARTRTWRKEY